MALQDGAVRIAHVVCADGARPRVVWVHSQALPDMLSAWQALRRQRQLDKLPIVAVLAPDQYALVTLDPPEVPRADWADALRWKLRDVVDFAVDDAAVDVLAVPPASPEAPVRSVFAIAAAGERIRQLAQRCDDAGLRLEAVDVVETSLRNLCALTGDSPRARALLWIGPLQTVLVVTLRGELLLARRIDAHQGQVASPDEDAAQAVRERIALEVQRTLDLCERLFGYANLAGLAVAPFPLSDRLVDYLGDIVYVPVQTLALDTLVDLSSAPDLGDATSQGAWAVALGAALRPPPERR